MFGCLELEDDHESWVSGINGIKSDVSACGDAFRQFRAVFARLG